MLEIRNLKKTDFGYNCEYRADGDGSWGELNHYNNDGKVEVVRIASNDVIYSNFTRRHLKHAIDKAVRLNRTEAMVMWY